MRGLRTALWSRAEGRDVRSAAEAATAGCGAERVPSAEPLRAAPLARAQLAALKRTAARDLLDLTPRRRVICSTGARSHEAKRAAHRASTPATISIATATPIRLSPAISPLATGTT